MDTNVFLARVAPHTCEGQSYVTLVLTSSDPKVHPVGQAKGAAACIRDEGVAAISLCAGAMAAATTERQSLLACCAGVSHKAEHPTSREVRADMWEMTMGGAPLACARGRAKATLVLAAHGPKLRNFGVCTCEHQNYLASDRWCSHGRDQSYVTLAPTSVGTNGHRRGALVLTRVELKVT